MDNRVMPPYPEHGEPEEIWTGVADVNAQGVAIAVKMLTELDRNDLIGSDVRERDLCELEDWPRLGTPFRNIVAEYLQRAREAGSEVEAGFCAVLTDMLAMQCSGSVRTANDSARWYAEQYPVTEAPHG